MMVPNQANDPFKPHLQVVTDNYLADLDRLHNASGCLARLFYMSQLAVRACRIPIEIASELSDSWRPPY